MTEVWVFEIVCDGRLVAEGTRARRSDAMREVASYIALSLDGNVTAFLYRTERVLRVA